MSAINHQIAGPTRTILDQILAFTPKRKPRRKAASRANHKRRNLQFEGLEHREMFSVSSVQLNPVTQVLDIRSDNNATTVQVDQVGSTLRVKGTGYDKSFSGPVREIRFTGGNQGDWFRNNTNVPVTAYGNGGSDTLIGGAGNDKLDGGEGRDSLWGGFGNDALYGGTGGDDLHGGANHDTLHGGADIDFLYGDEPNDNRNGTYGNDNLYGGTGNDRLDGGNGNDGLFGGVGDKDTLIGGLGADRFLQPENMESRSEYYYKNGWQQFIGHKSLRTVWELVSEDSTDFNSKDDAVVKFKSLDNPTIGSEKFTKQYWTNSDIERVDKALEKLHHLRGNTQLLETASGGTVTIGRVGRQTTLLPNKSDWVPGWVNGKDLIAVTEEAFARNWDDDMLDWGFGRL